HICLFFFFQAEDGIRDRNVTGVQTCALPISMRVEVDEVVETGPGSRLRCEVPPFAAVTLVDALGNPLPLAVRGEVVQTRYRFGVRPRPDLGAGCLVSRPPLLTGRLVE